MCNGDNVTVIAYRDGILASDSQVTSGDIKVGICRKVTKTEDGWLAGAAGGISSVQQFLNWAEIRDPDIFVKLDESFTGFLIDPEGITFIVESDLVPFEVKAEFHAEGHGREVAIGAMATGATAEEAVAIAIKYVDGCGGEIQVVKL